MLFKVISIEITLNVAVMEVNGEQLVKVVSWYDNEMSYTAQLIRTLGYFANLAK